MDPLAPTTTLPVDPCDPNKDGDAIAEAPPIATNPVASTLPQVAVVNPDVSLALLKKAKANLDSALAAREISAHNVIALQERYRLLGAERNTADSAILALQHKVEEAKQVYIDRSVMSYVRGSSIEVNSTLDATSPLQAQSRRTMFGAILDGDHRALEVYKAALVGVEEARRAMFDTSRHVSRQVQMLRIQLADEDKYLGVLHQTVLSLEAGGEVAVDGFVFPVVGEHSFTDTFGAPRMIGTPNAHVHQGTDINCELGTALVASETGIVEKVWVNPLGGNSIWLAGTSGTYYYYAHLSEYAVGLHEQQRVKGGEVVGYCGITGNAEGPHLHFEIHPGGGIAINPYPILRIADEVSARVAAGLPPYELGGLAPSIKDAITGVTTTVAGQTTTTVVSTTSVP